jgi:hypothetical protein
MEGHRLWIFGNRILRPIFGSRRDENGEWRRFHNEKAYSLYRSPNSLIIARRLTRVEVRVVFYILTG